MTTSRFEPAEVGRRLIQASRYMVIGTLDPDGRPRVSPVYFAPKGYDTLYWISTYDSHHSRNIAERPEISIVIFGSEAPIGDGRAVYMLAHAEEVPGDVFDEAADHVCAVRFPEMKPFPREELRPPERFRVYRAAVSEHSVHIRGSDPDYGTGADHRMVVRL